ncbi:hypothetical protein J3R83DRAFT_10765 [Lanmaoa asiatica]|nr:hypothetical protein J3R83DRAFT_10765 [Lanmaoa asiatica]
MTTDSSGPQLPLKPPASPPIANTPVRPFTSQGGTFGNPHQPLTIHPLILPMLTSVPTSPQAHARRTQESTVDSLPTPEYPPLPPLPTPFAVQDVVLATAATGATTLPATTTATTTTAMTPTPDALINGAQLLVTEPIPQTPQVSLTFLLVSGLRKTQSFEPETTIGRVKELVWNAWPARDAGSSSFPFRLRDDRPCLTDFSF